MYLMRYKPPQLSRETTLTIYQALQLATPGDIAVARRAFINQYGQEIYETYLQNYAECSEPAFLIYAPKTIYLVWIWYKLAQIIARRTELELLVPPEWIALDPPEDPLIPCSICGKMTSESTKESGEKININGAVCIVCYMNILQLWKFKKSGISSPLSE
jgi:hypothetical protein